MNFSLHEFLRAVVCAIYDFHYSYSGPKGRTIREWMTLFSDFVNRRY